MLVAVDVGNTNMVFGVFKGDTLIGSFRMVTGTHKTADEIGLTISQYFQHFHLVPKDVEDVIIASVVPQIMGNLCRAMVKYFGKQPLIVDQDIFPSIRYDAKERLGADRSVSCEAAMEKYGMPLIVLDFGTATTVDTISHDGYYLGGSILAGLQVMVDALFTKASNLPQVTLSKPSSVLGMDAIGQMQGGSIGGYLGAVEYLIRESKKEMGYGDQVKVVATGGLAGILAESTTMIDIVDEQLILDGLHILYKAYKNNNIKKAES